MPYLIPAYLPGELEACSPANLTQRMANERPLAFFIFYEGSLYPPNAWLDLPGAPTHRIYESKRNENDRFSLYQFIP